MLPILGPDVHLYHLPCQSKLCWWEVCKPTWQSHDIWYLSKLIITWYSAKLPIYWVLLLGFCKVLRSGSKVYRCVNIMKAFFLQLNWRKTTKSSLPANFMLNNEGFFFLQPFFASDKSAKYLQKLKSFRVKALRRLITSLALTLVKFSSRYYAFEHSIQFGMEVRTLEEDNQAQRDFVIDMLQMLRKW